jgi:hypothetical protein
MGGTAFPAGVAAGDRFYRTDLGMEFFYDGTRWLSTEVFVSVLGGAQGGGSISASTNNNGYSAVDLLGGSDFWMLNVATTFYVLTGGTALAAGHAWTATIERTAEGSGGFPAVVVQVLNSGVNGGRRLVAAINALAGATCTGFRQSITKTGTPGAIFVQTVVTYRIVAV